MSKKAWQVILAGEGGQGLVFIGALLGEAAVADGKNAAQSASYTIASRGGFTKADVVISSEEISFPEVTEPDVILALSSGALAKYAGSLNPETTLIYDSIFTDGPQGDNCFALPLSETVKSAAAGGKKVPLNLVGLGAVLAVSEAVNWLAFEKVLKDKFPKAEIVKANWDALRTGAELLQAARTAY